MRAASLADDLLLAGARDWIHFGEVSWFVAQRCPGASTEDRIAAALDIIRALLERGLIQAGELAGEGFTAWTCPTAEILERVRTRWRSLDHEPQPGDIAWLANTELGDTAAAELTDVQS